MRGKFIAVVIVFLANVALAEDWHFKQQLLPVLAEKVPAILKSQDETTGRFGLVAAARRCGSRPTATEIHIITATKFSMPLSKAATR